MVISQIKVKRNSSTILIPGERIKRQCPEKLVSSISRALEKFAYRLPDIQLLCNFKSCGLAFMTGSLLLCQTAAILMSFITPHKTLEFQPSTSVMQLN